jgi:hypothetical protein
MYRTTQREEKEREFNNKLQKTKHCVIKFYNTKTDTSGDTPSQGACFIRYTQKP